MKKQHLNVVIQLMIWLALFILQIILLPSWGKFPTIFDDISFYRTIIPEDILIFCIFYLNYLVLVPNLLGKRRKGLYILASILIFGLFLFFPVFLDFFFGIKYHGRFGNPKIINHWLGFVGIIILGISLGMRSVQEWLRAEQRNREMEYRRTLTELRSLKTQINPHFLFNTLNTIYALSLKNSENTSTAILRLSTMMRYVLSDAKNDFVPLEKEVEYIEQYIELQKLRSTDKLELDVCIKGDYTSAQIAPLLLIPFIENAFKYGVSNHETSPISLYLFVEEDRLLFEMHNKKFKSEPVGVSGEGIGIANTTRRLQLLYPKRHKLKIEEKDNSYNVHLEIRLKGEQYPLEPTLGNE